MVALVGGTAFVLGAGADAERPSKQVRPTSRSVQPTAADPTCVDDDGDGYGSANLDDCANPGLLDCDDDDGAVNPGATEKCNGIDDDCDTEIDEGFTLLGIDGEYGGTCEGGPTPDAPCTLTEDCNVGRCVDGMCVGGPTIGAECSGIHDCNADVAKCVGNNPNFLTEQVLPVGAACVNGLGICAVIGEVACADPDTAVCDAVPSTAEIEGPVGDASCYDHKDNDCDGVVDHGTPDAPGDDCQGPELCNGFDDDANGIIDDGLTYEGIPLGDPCSVGIGMCENSGEVMCDGNDGTMCSVSPLPGGVETGPGALRCRDGADNDCDGLVDLNDPGCQEAEKCDSRDNDGDGAVDEDFATLGDSCTSGVGPCQVSGTVICSADGAGTLCSAIPLTGSPEGPSGTTCTDGIDNDCDGMTDDADPGCASSDLTAACALPYMRGQPGNDCTGWHTIRFGATGGGENTEVIAELLGLDVNGSILAILPVETGEAAHLASRIPPADWKWASKTNSKGTRHEMFAPIPMLRVTAQDGLSKTQAFCSNIPYLQVLEPADTVVSASESTDTPVLVAIPLVDPTTLSIKVDGVDILQPAPIGLGLDPATAFPGGPYDGTVQIGGNIVTVSGLTVNSAPVDRTASNSLSMILSNLGCGGHIVVVEGHPLPGVFPKKPGAPATTCHNDDLNDSGTSMVFSIEITSPAPGEITAGGPTHVTGQACHGREITGVNINGHVADLSGHMCVEGNGVDSATTCTVPIDEWVPQTDLRAVVDGGGTPGTFTHGANRLIAQAVDADFNTTYDTFFFAVGPVVSAPSSIASVVAGVPEPGKVDRAFVLSITQDGIDTFFGALKNRNKRCLGDRARRNFQGLRKTKKIDVECDPWTTMVINNTALQSDNFPLEVDLTDSTTSDPRDGGIGVTIRLPNIDLFAHFGGYCESGCFLGICAVCVTVNVNGKMVQKNMSVSFDVERDRLLQTGVPREERDPLNMEFDRGTNDPADAVRISGSIDIGCLLGFFLDFINFFVQVFTLGFVDLNLSTIDFEFTGEDMLDRFGSLDGDPFDLDLVKFENTRLEDFGTEQRDHKVSDAAISSTGLAVAIGASFAPKRGDIVPDAANIVGTPLKNAPIPIPPILDAAGNPAGHVTIGISDDVFNQLFFSMVQTGRLKTEFEASRELGQFLPIDCSEIDSERRQARCYGTRGYDCLDIYPLIGGDVDLRRQCRRAARIERNTNIGIDTTLILNGRVHVPPKILIDDDPATDPVEITLVYDQISIHLIADRDENGTFDSDALESVPACSFGDLDAEYAPQSTDITECVLWETCLSVQVNLTMEVVESPITGRSRIKLSFVDLNRDVPFGVLCGGTTDVPELDFFNDTAGRTEILDILEGKLRDNTPGLDTGGMKLGGFVNFERDRIIAIETDNAADGFQDYIGITGNLVPTPVDPAEEGCD